MRTGAGDPFRFCGTCDTIARRCVDGSTALHGAPALTHYMAIYGLQRAM